MVSVDIRLNSQKDMTEFVNRCERAFEARLDDVAKQVVSDKELHIIALSGPTCSGKTICANKLIYELEAAGKNIHLISIDDFFKERDILKRESEIAADSGLDYDSVNAIDLGLLTECTESILAGKPTILPRYDFVSGKRGVRESVDPDESSIFIFEGIQAIYPEVTSLFGKNYKSVFISVADDLELNGVYFGRRDIRLLRRLVRDYKFRGAAPEFTFYIWRSVALNEDRCILPYADTTDIQIDSLMPYEPMLLKNELTAILPSVAETSKYYPKALEILEKLDKLESIDAKLVPKNSLLREFIGNA